MTFEGTSEDYKENDAVLFFDGRSFRLERLHRAVKRLRHVRLPGESSAATLAAADGGSPPFGKGVKAHPPPPPPPSSRTSFTTSSLPPQPPVLVCFLSSPSMIQT